MTYRLMYSSLPKLRRDTAKSIANCLLSCKKCTRRDIAKYANISDMSASKAAASLFESGIISEKEQKSPSTKRPCGFISISCDNPYVIIDVSARVHKMYCLNASFNILSQYNYKCESSFSDSDNLNVFLERGYKAISEEISYFCGICVVTGSNYENEALISSITERVFSHAPDIIIDIGVAISYLMRSNIDHHLPVNSLFYINIGSGCESYFVFGDNVVKCNPHKLIGKNNAPVGDMIDSCVNSAELYEIIFDIFNCASAMLSPDVLILESDRFILGSQMAFNLSKKLKINFSDRRKLLISDKLPHLYIKGALHALLHTLIVNVLSNNN